MEIQINKVEFSDEDKLVFVQQLENKRDKELKDKIEKAEMLDGLINTRTVDLAHLDAQSKSLTETVDAKLREEKALTLRLNQITTQAHLEQQKLDTLTRDYSIRESAQLKSTAELEQKHDKVKEQLTSLQAVYERNIQSNSDELNGIILGLSLKQAELRQTLHLEKFTKGYFITQIQKLLDKKGIKVDVLKELNM